MKLNYTNFIESELLNFNNLGIQTKKSSLNNY